MYVAGIMRLWPCHLSGAYQGCRAALCADTVTVKWPGIGAEAAQPRPDAHHRINELAATLLQAYRALIEETGAATRGRTAGSLHGPDSRSPPRRNGSAHYRACEEHMSPRWNAPRQREIPVPRRLALQDAGRVQAPTVAQGRSAHGLLLLDRVAASVRREAWASVPKRGMPAQIRAAQAPRERLTQAVLTIKKQHSKPCAPPVPELPSDPESTGALWVRRGRIYITRPEPFIGGDRQKGG